MIKGLVVSQPLFSMRIKNLKKEKLKMAQAQFPEPKDLEVSFVNRIGDSQPKSFGQYSVSNPHPGYGTDPNILNEYGHSVYPKMIYPNGISQPGITVNSEAEEARYYKPEPAPVQAPAPNGGWGAK